MEPTSGWYPRIIAAMAAAGERYRNSHLDPERLAEGGLAREPPRAAIEALFAHGHAPDTEPGG